MGFNNIHGMDGAEEQVLIGMWRPGNLRRRPLFSQVAFTLHNRRKKGGSKYPPASIHLQYILRRNNRQPFDIFDKKEVCTYIYTVPRLPWNDGEDFLPQGGRRIGKWNFHSLLGIRITAWNYVENGLKAFRGGGAADLRRENKVVQQYPCPAVGCACHVYLLDLYFAKLPEGAKEKSAFYFSAQQWMQYTWWTIYTMNL